VASRRDVLDLTQKETRMKLLIALAALTCLAAAPIDDLEKDGRRASDALRDFQTLELKAYRSQSRWPTSEQHAQITTRLGEAADGIARSLVLGLDRPTAQVVSMMATAGKAVTTLTPWVTPIDDQPTAPANVVKALAKLRTAYAQLLTHFPPIRVTDEQLTR
jgi:hypothetical protein